MPTTDEILDTLSLVAQDYSRYAIMWHILFFLLVVALILRWRPENRFMASLMSLPLLSVSIFSWLAGNPLSGSLFGIFFILLLVLGLKNTRSSIMFASPFWSIAGLVFIIFGLIYPHFIEVDSFIEYAYLSPAGILPCPTLVTVTGFTLLLNGFKSRSWSITLFIIGAFYGVVGFFWLDVYLDAGLILASLLLLFQALSSSRQIREDPLS